MPYQTVHTEIDLLALAAVSAVINAAGDGNPMRRMKLVADAVRFATKAHRAAAKLGEMTATLAIGE